MLRPRGLRLAAIAAFAASMPGRACRAGEDLGGVFVCVRPVQGHDINTPSADFAGSVSSDGLTIYLTSIRPPVPGWIAQDPGFFEDWDIYVAHRKDRDAPFEPVRDELAHLNSPLADTTPRISHDGTRLYFCSDRLGNFVWNVYHALRDDVTKDFGEAVNEGPDVNPPGCTQSSHTVSPDGTIMVVTGYVRDCGGQWAGQASVGECDLWMLTSAPGEWRFSNPVNLGLGGHQVNSDSSEDLPCLSSDTLALFFCDNSFYWTGFRFRDGGQGKDDIWVARRTSRDGFFGKPQNVGPPISSEYYEIAPFPSFEWPAPRSTFYFASDRPHPLGRGALDVFVATWLAAAPPAALKVAFKDEPARESGAINCGGWEVKAAQELGIDFERDRFIGDDLEVEGDPAAGFSVTRALLGHKADVAVWGEDCFDAVDVSRIPGAGAEAAKLFATRTWSQERLHYQAQVVPGRCEVTLYFSESSLEALGTTGQGTRLIDASICGQKVLGNWSAAAAAGSPERSGNPRVLDGARLRTAVARTFSADIPPGGDLGGGAGTGTLDIAIEKAEASPSNLPPALNAFSFKRIGDATGAPASGDVECVVLDPAVDLEKEAYELARKRWAGGAGELSINCGGPLLACASENPAPGPTGDPSAGERVVWLDDLAAGADVYAFENEFFEVRSLEVPWLGRQPELAVLPTDMGTWDARGTEGGLDRNDSIFHAQRVGIDSVKRLGGFEYGIPVPNGDYEVTLYFANAFAESAGTGLRFFQVWIENRIEGFDHCPNSGVDGTGAPIANAAAERVELYDPVDQAEKLYSQEWCAFPRCEPSGVTSKKDPDLDGVPAFRECGNAAATAVRRTVAVKDGNVTVSLLPPDVSAGEPWCVLPPSIAGLSVKRIQIGWFKRGDANADGRVNIADAICALGYLFGPSTDLCKQGVPRCFDAADANDDGKVNVADAIAILGHLFGKPGLPLPLPFDACGDDPTADALGCERYDRC